MAEDETVRLCVLGAGSVRCMPAVIGSLATFFGERPLEIRFWDADEERLDLFDRFARLCFVVNKSSHRLISTDDPLEALEEADRVVISVGENCARRRLVAAVGQSKAEVIACCVRDLLGSIAPDAAVLSLIDCCFPGWCCLDWPKAPTEKERRALPHRVLRYLHEDEYLHDFLRAHADTPLKDWLNGR